MCINAGWSKPGADQLDSELDLLQHSVQVAEVVWDIWGLATHIQVHFPTKL